jgi:ribosomal protein S18 acetylase RimI-like enzyme
MTTELPTGWLIRPPTLDDVPEILAVVHASDIVAVGEPDYTTEEVVEILAAPNHDPQRDSWVALDETGHIVGWAYVDNPSRGQRDNLDAYVHPEYGRPAQPVLLDLVLARIAARATEFGYPYLTARAGAIASETSYVELLRSAGFTFVKRYARMRRDLAPNEPAPQVPGGVTIRLVCHDDDDEMRAFHRVLDLSFRDTPDYQPTSYETYREKLAVLPGIDWDEWFVAEVDGEVVAILQSAGQVAEQDEGWVKNLGVSKEYRGRGLGRILLLTAFHAYARKGRRAAGLGVDMTNPTGAYRLYESVGLSPVYESDVYERRIDGA